MTSAADRDASERRVKARARELLVLGSIVATVLWTIAIIDATGAAGRGRLSGLPLGTDFVQFYTLAHVGHTGRFGALASLDAFHVEQVQLLPDSSTTNYPPVYPPQAALALQPLALLGYYPAYVTWSAVTLLVYVGVVLHMARAAGKLSPWPRQVVAVAAANPAVWFLVLHGQLSIVGLLALYLAWLALNAEGRWLTGAAIGLLAYKPSLFVPALALCLIARDWRVAGGAVATATAQYAVAIPWAGTAALHQYMVFMLELLGTPDKVASNLPLMHSLRTFWAGLLPAPMDTVAYALSAFAVLIVAASCWRRARHSLDRVAALGAGIVLAAPHLFVYDLVLLTPLILASAELSLAGHGTVAIRRLTYAAFFAPLWGIPLVTLGFQASTIALVALLVTFNRSCDLRSMALR